MRRIGDDEVHPRPEGRHAERIRTRDTRIDVLYESRRGRPEGYAVRLDTCRRTDSAEVDVAAQYGQPVLGRIPGDGCRVQIDEPLRGLGPANLDR